MNDADSTIEYYFNTATRMVEKGRQSSWEHLMGPYATHEEAQRAFEIARDKSADWDEDDAAWRDDDD